MSKNLIQVGFWYSEFEPHFPMPIENSDNLDDVSRQKIIDYLDSQIGFRSQKGTSLCRICGIRNGNKEGSDEKYIWPSGLSHYVKNHKVTLPDFFVNHILGKNNEKS